MITRSLYWQSAGLFIGAFALLALAAVVGIERSTRIYHHEATQRLHRDLASWVVTHYGFDRADGLDPDAIRKVFDDAMHVNPTIELYVLDLQGNIKAFNAPPGSVRADRIDLAPLRAHFEHPNSLPVFGDDPRKPGSMRIFSAAPLGRAGAADGYLYIVIGGERYRGFIDHFRRSHILRISFGLTIAALLAGIAWGMLNFVLLTGRVRRIAGALQAFRASGFSSVPATLPVSAPSRAADELDRVTIDLRALMLMVVGQFDRLRENDNKLRELVASLSHDLRTPLTALGCYLETVLLKDHELSAEERRSHISLAARHHARLRRLVDSLFEFAQLELPGLRIELQATSLGDLLLDVAEKFRLRAVQLGVKLEVRVPEELPLVEADAGLLERVLDNLIDNALRFTPYDGRIDLVVEHAGSQVRTIVRDSGVGIPADHVKRIFDRFYRVDRSRNDAAAGAGLGLAIARRIVELHGGTLVVQSHPGKGSAFSFALRSVAQDVPSTSGRSESGPVSIPEGSEETHI